MIYLKQYLSIFLIIIVNAVFSQNNEKTLTTDYYSIANGNYSANIWSTSCHTCVTCNSAPACNVPPNTKIYIKHNVTSTCTTLDVGANSTFILSPGGSFSLLGNGSITGSGSLTVSSGASLTVTGNLTLSGGGDATISGVVNVSGTLNIGGSSDVCGGGSISAGAMTGSADCGGVAFGGNLAVLPIELIDFNASCLTNGIQLNWSTASEIENDYFLVDKSLNGIDWQQVAKVGGNGTSNSINKYIHIDYTANSNGLVYYRLSQVDKDRKTTIFKMIDVICSNVPDKMILYPNPASTELNIHLDVNAASANNIIKLINNIGETVMETKVDLTKGFNSFIFPVDFQSGTYTILFSSENIVVPSQKLLVIK
jgi:hypothetical protein